jgi:formate dehydrogenase subunit gamma
MRPVDHEAGLADRISRICADHAHLEGPLLPILHAVQDEIGCLPEAAILPIAEALNISRAEVHGVISFYHDFRTEPAGRHVLRICRAEACQAMGGRELGDAARARLGIDWHGTTDNGAVTLEPVYCLGLCACGPAAMVDDRVVGRVDAGILEDIFEKAGA